MAWPKGLKQKPQPAAGIHGFKFSKFSVANFNSTASGYQAFVPINYAA
jgi:hypothetical protein